jgi:hypothetical protein
LIKTISHKEEEDFIIKAISKDNNFLKNNNYFLNTTNSDINNMYDDSKDSKLTNSLHLLSLYNKQSMSVFQNILEKFKFKSLRIFEKFISNNIINLINSELGICIVSKYLRLINSANKKFKNKAFNQIKNNMPNLLLSVKGIQLILQIVENWEALYLKKLIKDCYDNLTITKYSNLNIIIGINNLFNSLISHEKRVSIIFVIF